MIVYCAKSIDNKFYIGVTTRALATRINEHKCHALTTKKGGRFYDYIRANGFDGLSFIELEKLRSDDDKFAAEKKYIKMFDTYSSGLNDSLGGQGANGYKRSKATVAKALSTRMSKFPYVLVYKDGSLFGRYRMVKQAARALGVDDSYLLKVVKGLRPQRKDFKIMYEVGNGK